MRSGVGSNAYMVDIQTKGHFNRTSYFPSSSTFTFILVAMSFVAVIVFVGCSSHYESESGDSDKEIVRTSSKLMTQTLEQVDQKSKGCMSCHTEIDSPSMHKSPAVHIGCIDCHGGNPDVLVPSGAVIGSAAYEDAKNKAHVLPKYPEIWKTSANPERTYTILLKESAEFVRFFNPGDLRVVEETCGGGHSDVGRRGQKSPLPT